MFTSNTFKVETEDGHNFRLLEAVTYNAVDGSSITIPAGSLSDGASVPAVYWNLIPPFGDYWKAAFLHDYLYRHTTMPKEQCDNLFYEAMLACGTNANTADTIYEAVKLCGIGAFRKDRTTV